MRNQNKILEEKYDSVLKTEGPFSDYFKNMYDKMRRGTAGVKQNLQPAIDLAKGVAQDGLDVLGKTKAAASNAVASAKSAKDTVKDTVKDVGGMLASPYIRDFKTVQDLFKNFDPNAPIPTDTGTPPTPRVPGQIYPHEPKNITPDSPEDAAKRTPLKLKPKDPSSSTSAGDPIREKSIRRIAYEACIKSKAK